MRWAPTSVFPHWLQKAGLKELADAAWFPCPVWRCHSAALDMWELFCPLKKRIARKKNADLLARAFMTHDPCSKRGQGADCCASPSPGGNQTSAGQPAHKQKQKELHTNNFRGGSQPPLIFNRTLSQSNFRGESETDTSKGLLCLDGTTSPGPVMRNAHSRPLAMRIAGLPVLSKSLSGEPTGDVEKTGEGPEKQLHHCAPWLTLGVSLKPIRWFRAHSQGLHDLIQKLRMLHIRALRSPERFFGPNRPMRDAFSVQRVSHLWRCRQTIGEQKMVHGKDAQYFVHKWDPILRHAFGW